MSHCHKCATMFLLQIFSNHNEFFLQIYEVACLRQLSMCIPANWVILYNSYQILLSVSTTDSAIAYNRYYIAIISYY